MLELNLEDRPKNVLDEWLSHKKKTFSTYEDIYVYSFV
jgi:hypothetical protein